MIKILLSTLLFAPVMSFAHGNKIEMVAMSTSTALSQFQAEETKSAASFSGVKAWISGANAMVRVYFNNNESSVVYTCVMHHGDNGEEHNICSQ